MRCAVCLPALFLLACTGLACTGDEPSPDPTPPECLDTIDASSCMPAYPAEYERLMSETLLPVCGVQGGACHGEADAEGSMNGLVITSDLDATHYAFLDNGFVTPGDVECSKVTVRIHLDADDPFLMPPGAKLDDAVVCAITQWVAAGAER